MGATRKRTRQLGTKKHTQKRSLKVYPPSSHIKPGTDFYMYVNKRWIEKTRIPDNQADVSITSELQTEVDKELYKLVQRSMKHPRTHDERAIGQFARTLTAPNAGELGLAALKELLGDIGCLKTLDDICAYMGRVAFSKMCGFISIYDGPEEKHSRHWRLHIGNGQLGLPAVDYYTGKVSGGRAVLNAYKDALERMGSLLGYSGLGEFAIMEEDYAQAIEQGDIEDTKIMYGNELIDVYGKICWDAIWSEYGLSANEWKQMRFVVDAPSWLRRLNHMCKTYTIDNWRVALRALCMLCYYRFIPESYRAHADDVFMEILLGVKSNLSPREKLLRELKTYMNVELSRVYLHHIKKPKYRTKIHAFVNTLLTAATRRIRAVPWLDTSTKRTAIQKIQKIHLGILYPTQVFYYTPPPLTGNSIQQIQALGMAHSRKELHDVREKLTTQIWDNPVYLVNAFYIAAGNRFILPAAIVEWPFYSRTASLGWNYGALGVVCGHEITHAFDENGKEYDEDGNMRSWWSRADNRAYNKRTLALNTLFSRMKLLGVRVDGEQTLSENIADLGGLAIALDALKFELDLAKVSQEVRVRELRDFFIAYATSWREVVRRQKALRNIVVDIHSPAKFRVNNIVQHFQEWYDVFEIQNDDALYLAPEKRITIF